MILKIGSKGDKVAELQIKLGLKGDGVFGPKTKAAVVVFQQQNGLTPDGVVGANTANLLGISLELDSDNTFYNQPTPTGLVIKKSYLDKDEYLMGNKPKIYLILHHTAGGSNPFNVVRDWNNDTRGRIGTQFIIGGTSLQGDSKYDGLVVECFPDEGYAFHLGNNGNSALHKQSVGIEVCNWGQLTQKNNRFYTYTGQEIPPSQVCTLPFKHRGFQFYHSYTPKQIEALELLIREIVRRHPRINIHAGLQQWLKNMPVAKAFEFNDDAFYGKYSGMFTHTHIRRDKTDMAPQPILVDMIHRL